MRRLMQIERPPRLWHSAPMPVAMISGAMVLIIDFNRPRDGFTRVDPAPLVWTIQGFAPAPVR